MSQQKKTDNHNPAAKLLLRRHFLPGGENRAAEEATPTG